MKLITLILALAVNASALTYTTDLNLAKPAVGDTNYVTPFATGMDTLDAAIPDKRVNKVAVFASSLTAVGPFTAQSSVTIKGVTGLVSATMTGPLTLSGSSLTVTGGNISIKVPATSEFGLVSDQGTNGSQILLGYNGTNDSYIKMGVTDAGVANYPNALVVNYNGRVGIGNTAPDQKLTIEGSMSNTGQVISSGTGTNYFAGNVGVGMVPTTTLSVYGRVLSDQTDAANDSEDIAFLTNFGADGSLGALGFTLRGKPSATGANRYIGLYAGDNGANRPITVPSSFFGAGTTSPDSSLQVGTPLDGTTSYMQVDTLLADTAGPPAATDCDAATEVGRMVVSSRYTATASNFLWVCMQTAASTFAWWKTELTAP